MPSYKKAVTRLQRKINNILEIDDRSLPDLLSLSIETNKLKRHENKYTFSITNFFMPLLISACSNNDNYPKEYIGFEKQFISHTYDTKNEEETLTLKIIAAEKQDTDRKLTISRFYK